MRALRVILRDAGFEAVTAASGEEALDRAAVERPEAAILDLMLPDIDGVEVTRRLREWSEMPILVLSAVGEEDAKVAALERRRRRLRDQALRPARADRPAGGDPAPRPARARAADAASPTASRSTSPATPCAATASRSTSPRPSSSCWPTLARNRGRLLTHRTLLVEVWGVEYEDDLQVLRAHVANLRRKIEPPDGPKYVLTDPGVGYRFGV